MTRTAQLIKRRVQVVVCGLVLPALAACATGPKVVPTLENSSLSPAVGVDLAAYTRTDDGLYFLDAVEGEGALAGPSSRVTVAYRLLLANGTQVDSSTGVVVRLNRDQIVDGWKLGIPGMRVGGARILVLPPALGYGSRRVADIPPNSVLIFRIQLLRVQ